MKPLRPLRSPQTLAEQTAELLRNQIFSGHFRSGERLVEARIASQLGTSRGPVREALKQLREEGLVREEPRRGAFVAGLTIQDVRDVYDLRAALEIRAVTLIIKNSDSAVLDALRRALGRIEAAARSADLARLAKSDYEFHETVSRVSGNPRLHDAFVRNASALRGLLRLEGDRSYESFDAIWAQHRDLLDGLVAGDSDRAVALFTQHIEEARDRLMELLSNPSDSTGSPRR